MTPSPLAGIVATALDVPPPVVPRLRTALEPVEIRFGEDLVARSGGTWSEVYTRPADADEFAGVAQLLRSFGIDTLALGTSPHADGMTETEIEPNPRADTVDARVDSESAQAPAGEQSPPQRSGRLPGDAPAASSVSAEMPTPSRLEARPEIEAAPGSEVSSQLGAPSRPDVPLRPAATTDPVPEFDQLRGGEPTPVREGHAFGIAVPHVDDVMPPTGRHSEFADVPETLSEGRTADASRAAPASTDQLTRDAAGGAAEHRGADSAAFDVAPAESAERRIAAEAAEAKSEQAKVAESAEGTNAAQLTAMPGTNDDASHSPRTPRSRLIVERDTPREYAAVPTRDISREPSAIAPADISPEPATGRDTSRESAIAADPNRSREAAATPGDDIPDRPAFSVDAGASRQPAITVDRDTPRGARTASASDAPAGATTADDTSVHAAPAPTSLILSAELEAAGIISVPSGNQFGRVPVVRNAEPTPPGVPADIEAAAPDTVRENPPPGLYTIARPIAATPTEDDQFAARAESVVADAHGVSEVAPLHTGRETSRESAIAADPNGSREAAATPGDDIPDRPAFSVGAGASRQPAITVDRDTPRGAPTASDSDASAGATTADDTSVHAAPASTSLIPPAELEAAADSVVAREFAAAGGLRSPVEAVVRDGHGTTHEVTLVEGSVRESPAVERRHTPHIAPPHAGIASVETQAEDHQRVSAARGGIMPAPSGNQFGRLPVVTNAEPTPSWVQADIEAAAPDTVRKKTVDHHTIARPIPATPTEDDQFAARAESVVAEAHGVSDVAPLHTRSAPASRPRNDDEVARDRDSATQSTIQRAAVSPSEDAASPSQRTSESERVVSALGTPLRKPPTRDGQSIFRASADTANPDGDLRTPHTAVVNDDRRVPAAPTAMGDRRDDVADISPVQVVQAGGIDGSVDRSDAVSDDARTKAQRRESTADGRGSAEASRSAVVTRSSPPDIAPVRVAGAAEFETDTIEADEMTAAPESAADEHAARLHARTNVVRSDGAAAEALDRVGAVRADTIRNLSTHGIAAHEVSAPAASDDPSHADFPRGDSLQPVRAALIVDPQMASAATASLFSARSTNDDGSKDTATPVASSVFAPVARDASVHIEPAEVTRQVATPVARDDAPDAPQTVDVIIAADQAAERDRNTRTAERDRDARTAERDRDARTAERDRDARTAEPRTDADGVGQPATAVEPLVRPAGPLVRTAERSATSDDIDRGVNAGAAAPFGDATTFEARPKAVGIEAATYADATPSAAVPAAEHGASQLQDTEVAGRSRGAGIVPAHVASTVPARSRQDDALPADASARLVESRSPEPTSVEAPPFAAREPQSRPNAAFPAGPRTRESQPTERRAVEPDSAESFALESHARAAEPPPLDSVRVESARYESRLTESRPAAASRRASQSNEPRALESYAVESEAVGSDLVDSGPAVSHPIEPQPFVSHAVEPQPFVSHAVEPQPFVSHAVEPQPFVSRPFESQPFVPHRIESRPTQSHPADSSRIEARSIESIGYEARPVEFRSAESHPLESRALEAAPPETHPIPQHPGESRPTTEARTIPLRFDPSSAASLRPISGQPAEANAIDVQAAGSVAVDTNAGAAETVLSHALDAQPSFGIPAADQHAVRTPGPARAATPRAATPDANPLPSAPLLSAATRSGSGDAVAPARAEQHDVIVVADTIQPPPSDYTRAAPAADSHDVDAIESHPLAPQRERNSSPQSAPPFAPRSPYGESDIVQRAGAEAVAPAPVGPSAAIAASRADNGARLSPHAVNLESDARNAALGEIAPRSTRAPLTADAVPLTTAANTALTTAANVPLTAAANAPLTAAANAPLTAVADDPFAAGDANAIFSHPPRAEDTAPAANAIRVSQAARVPDAAQHDAGTAIAISVIEPAFDDLVAVPRPYVVPAYHTTTIAPAQPPPADASRTATARDDGSAPERKIRIIIDRIEIAAAAPPPPRPKPRPDTSMSLEAFLGRRR